MRRFEIAEIGVAVALQRLLQRVQMQVQSLRADRLDQPPRIVDAHAVVQLHRTEVCKQHDLRRNRPHREGRSQGGLLEHRAAAAERERDPRRFGRAGPNAG